MTRVVLDTNALASGSIAFQGTLASIIDAWRSGEFSLFVSPPILAELERTLEKPYFRQRLTVEQSSRFLVLLRRGATVSPITVQVQGVASHPSDDLVLATVISAKADYLVTGDANLQQLGSYESVTILSPREFLDLLTTHQLDFPRS
jgi:putative PIN family toxin of toxin-antitoxin system